MSADILALSKTSLIESDADACYRLSGFTLHRYDFEGNGNQRSVYGLAIYIKDSVTHRNIRKTCVDNIQIFAVDIACSCQWVTVIFMHLPPKLTLSIAKMALRQINLDYSTPMLVGGDCKFDSQLSSGFIEFMLRRIWPPVP